MLQQTIELAQRIIKMHDDDGLSFGAIGTRTGKSQSYVHKLYNEFKQNAIYGISKPTLKDTGDSERVTIAIFNPNEDADCLNQLTITVEIKAGLEIEEKCVAINAALAEGNLIKWVEVKK